MSLVIMVIAMLSRALSLAAEPSPDFDGNGVVDVADFLSFVDAFGSQEGEEKYEAKYDLNSDGKIEDEDFQIFVSSFGKDSQESPSSNAVARAATNASSVAMYWVDNHQNRIQSAYLDGQNTHSLVTGLGSPVDIALDLSSNKMYWTDRGTDKIQRSDLNGANIQDVVTDLSSPVGIALDLSSNKMYWTDNGTKKIQRSDLNGENIQDVVTDLSSPVGIALDLSSNKMYWTDRGTDKIQRSDLNGENIEDLVTGLVGPAGIALDVSGGKMYWVDNSTDKIQRSDLNGENIEDLVTGLGVPWGIALDLSSNKIYWTDNGKKKIQSADLNGQNVKDVLTIELGKPVGIVLGNSNSKLLNRVPVFTSGYPVTRSIPENIPPEQPIGDPISATDAEGDSLIYSLSGVDKGSFTIDAHTGQIQTKEGITYDYEEKNSYWVTVNANDGRGGRTTSIAVKVTLNDVKEPPSSPPSKFMVIPGDQSLSIYYAEAVNKPGKPLIRGYHAEIRKGEDGTWGNRKTIYGRTNTSFHYHELKVPRYYDPYLTNGQLYQVRVRTWNADGASDWSEPVSGTPVSEPQKVKSELAKFQGEGDMASAEIDLSGFTGEGSRIIIPRTALPENISQEEIKGIFVEILEVDVSGVPSVSPYSGFTFTESTSLFDIDLKVLVSKLNVDIDDVLSEPVEICLSVPEDVFDPVMIYYDESSKDWEMLEEQRVDGNVVCAFTDRFSLFGVAETVTPPPPPPPPPPPTLSMYWVNSENKKIQRADRDGSNIKDVVTRMEELTNLAIAGDKVYWTGYTGTVFNRQGKIQRADLDGSNVEDLITTGLKSPTDIALDVSGGKMYWTDSLGDKIQRADLDGSNVEDLITTGLGNPFGIALDIPECKMYWTDSTRKKIQRADLDGSNVEDLITGLGNPIGIALDLSGGKMYWVDFSGAKIQRADLDGSNVEDLITTGLSNPFGIAVDTSASKMYWTDSDTDKIQRADLDGSNVEDLITTGLDGLTGLVLHDPSAVPPKQAPIPPIYWTDNRDLKIQRKLDGSNVEDLITTGLSNPIGIAVDTSASKMYWTDVGTRKIQRSDLDGSNVEDLITSGLNKPMHIALDLSGSKMYWVDRGTDKIRRADLDGSNAEDLITTGLRNPAGIALDISGDKMYWTDYGEDKIKRADLDGSNVENLITTGLGNPTGIALDVSGGKMYWTDYGTDKIQRADLDGSNVEDLITGLDDPRGIALDTSESKMYWIEQRSDKIRQSDLDGCHIKDIITITGQNPRLMNIALGKGSGAGDQ